MGALRRSCTAAGDWLAWATQKGTRQLREDLRQATDDTWVLLAAGALMMAVGTLGYVFGDVPPGVERALPPLQVITDRTFGWLLATAGALVIALGVRPCGLRVGYGFAVGAFAVMGVWFALGWVTDPVLDTRPLASSAIYGFVTSILLIHARSARHTALRTGLDASSGCGPDA